MSNVIHIDLYGKNVKAKVAQLRKKMEEAAEEALINKATEIRDIAKTLAPEDTGALKASIRLERGGIGRRTVRVRAGGYVTNPKTGRKVDYAGIQELRTGFLQQAVAQVQPSIPAAIQNNVVTKVNHT